MSINVNLSHTQTKNEPPKSLEEIVSEAIEEVEVLVDVYDPETNTIYPASADELQNRFFSSPDEIPEINVVYKVIYPDDLNLKPSQKSRSKACRPKKKTEESPPKNKVQVVAKTRSGREVKFPKHIQKDFKKIEIKDDNTSGDANHREIKTSDFFTYVDKSKVKEVQKIENEKLLDLDSLQKKRKIASQFRCPKCKKAYLGRSKILEHLRKNPSHGPMHKSEENHFEVWNYLVSITQKCPSSERGQKFCQELSNLLHNLLLLTNALFKKLGSVTNEVNIDKVLGNAIGLSPGTYYFDDNNLYKDVTVLQLMGNTDFLNSIRSKADEPFTNSTSSTEKNCNCGKLSTIDELVLKSMQISSEANESIAKKIDNIKIDPQKSLDQPNHNNKNSNEGFSTNNYFVPPVDIMPNYQQVNDFEMKPEGLAGCTEDKSKNFDCLEEKKDFLEVDQNLKIKSDVEDNKELTENGYFPSDLHYETSGFDVSYESNSDGILNLDPTLDKQISKCPKIKIHSNILLRPPAKPSSENHTIQNKSHINLELLSDNSVLMPNLPHGVDELMLPVPSDSATILDNSCSSDEVMNVDQFVNERFRRITESDIDGSHSNSMNPSLNVYMPALDLFQFNST